MSLTGFHLLFIVLAAITAFSFGAWCFVHPADVAQGRLFGAGSVVLGAGLCIYGTAFYRKAKSLRAAETIK